MDMNLEEGVCVQSGRTWILHDGVEEELFHDGSQRKRNGPLEKLHWDAHTSWAEAVGGGDDWEFEGDDAGRNGVCFPLMMAPHS
jgi:hypothetical protein